MGSFLPEVSSLPALPTEQPNSNAKATKINTGEQELWTFMDAAPQIRAGWMNLSWEQNYSGQNRAKISSLGVEMGCKTIFGWGTFRVFKHTRDGRWDKG